MTTTSQLTALRRQVTSPGALATVAGSLGLLVVSVLLVPAREWLGNTNVALVLLVVVVAAAAFGGRLAGVATAVVAALAFNVIHTEPYATVIIERRMDVITTVLLALVGVAVGELTHRRIVSARRARRRDYAVSRVHRIAELVEHGRPVDDIATAVCDELSAELGLRAALYHPTPASAARARILHNGTIRGRIDAELPSGGAVVDLRSHGRPVAHLELLPGPRTRTSEAGLVVAVVMADLLQTRLDSPDEPVPPPTIG